VTTETDPGSKGKKLSKSDDDTLERRNKSFEKVLDLQIKYIRAFQEGLFDEVENAKARWKAKSQWHEKEFGW
jgi:hypothetical protein